MVGFAWLASAQPLIALGGAAALVVVGLVASRPGSVSAVLMGAYLIPLFALGRVYAYTGVDPIYVPEVLLLSALALSLPDWWNSYLVAVPRWYRWGSATLAIFGLSATWNGLTHGYPGALKGLVFVIYPLASGPCAAWIRVHDASWERIVISATMAAPIGLLVLTLIDSAEVIPAAYGFYLGGLIAFAATRSPGTRRWVLVTAAFIGPMLLLGTGRRGPILALIVTLLVAQIALRRMAGRSVRPLVIACAMGAGIILFAVGVAGVAPSHLPVVGMEVQRASSSFGAPGPEAEANVSFRLDLWQYSMTTALHHGFWFGTGFGRPFDFRFRSVDYRTVDTGGPHNSFIGVFYYLGVPAGLGFIAIVVGAFWSAAKNRSSDRRGAVQVAWLAAAVVTMFTNVALEGPYIGGPIWILIGWCVLARRAEVPEPTEAHHAALHA